jgi:MYXO-CTERM domain-containing protein
MKRTNLSKVVGTGVLALSLAILPSTLSASAQTGNGSDTTTTTPNTTLDNTQTQGTDYAATGDRDFDWGWLGLIGLAGLAGLARKREEPTRYRDPNVAGTTGYRE